MKKQLLVSVFSRQNFEYLFGVIIFSTMAITPTYFGYKSLNDFTSIMCLAMSVSLTLGGFLFLRNPDDECGPFSKIGLLLFLVNILCSITISWILTEHVIVLLVVALTFLLYTAVCVGFWIALVIHSYFWYKKFWAE